MLRDLVNCHRNWQIATACVAALDGVQAGLNICYRMRGYRRIVTEALPTDVQAHFERVTALPSYAATVKADAETGERLKGRGRTEI